MSNDNRSQWTERIQCPLCGTEQDATVEYAAWMPYPAYVHDCEECGYTVTESEWERVEAVGT